MFGLDMNTREEMALRPDSYYSVGRNARAIYDACASDDRPILNSSYYEGWTKENFTQEKFDNAIKLFELGFKFSCVRFINAIEEEAKKDKYSEKDKADGVKLVAFLRSLAEKREAYEITCEEATQAIREFLVEAFRKEGLNVR
jgi:hypothetical protein